MMLSTFHELIEHLYIFFLVKSLAILKADCLSFSLLLSLNAYICMYMWKTKFKELNFFPPNIQINPWDSLENYPADDWENSLENTKIIHVVCLKIRFIYFQ